MCMHELIMYKSTCMHYVCLRGNHKRLANMYVEKGFMRTSFKFAHQNQEFKVRGGRAGAGMAVFAGSRVTCKQVDLIPKN